MPPTISCILHKYSLKPRLTFWGTRRLYPAYSQPIAIRLITAGAFRARGNESAVTSVDAGHPHGDKPLQPFAGDRASRGYGRPGTACGPEPPPGGSVPATGRWRLVARGAQRA